MSIEWFGHVERMDEYCMARRVLMVGTRETEVRLDGWYEGGLGQQRNDGGGCASMHKRSERMESPSTYVTGQVLRSHFCLALCLSHHSPMLWQLSPGEEWDAVTSCGWDKL